MRGSAAIHELCKFGVVGSQPRESFVECFHTVVPGRDGEVIRLESPAAAIGGVAGAGVIDQTSSHRMSRGPQEVTSRLAVMSRR
jgi:hypothetical protein